MRLYLAECRRLAGSVAKLSNKPTIAGSQEMQLTEMAQRIENAARQAALPADSLVRIWPEPPRRLSDTSYNEKPTQIMLRNTTLQQLTSFLHALTEAPPLLRVSSLRLTTPRGQEAGLAWNIDITLTYLIYAPRENTAQRAQSRPPSQ